MQILIKVLIGAMILIVAIFAFAPEKEKYTLNGDRPSNPLSQHIYYYYPKANFYYDSTDDKYISLDSAGTEWKITEKLPVQKADLGKTVRIGQASEFVWKENLQHRLIYSVSLYSGANDFRYQEKINRRTNSIISTNPQKEEKKSGVRKFFERIFPPKKKKDS